MPAVGGTPVDLPKDPPFFELPRYRRSAFVDGPNIWVRAIQVWVLTSQVWVLASQNSVEITHERMGRSLYVRSSDLEQ